MIRLLLICLIGPFSYTGAAWAATELEDILNIPKAAFIVENVCEYTLYTKKASRGFVKVRTVSMGNAGFVEPESEPHLALTAGHVLECDQELGDRFFGDSLQKTDITSFEVKHFTTFAIYNGVRYPVNILEKGPNGLGPQDIAIISVILPKGLPHYHIPILKDKNSYGMKSAVSIYGFMPSIDEWRLKNGKIESLSDALIKVETHVYKGLSGSILLFWDGNRHYAIGGTFGGDIFNSHTIL